MHASGLTPRWASAPGETIISALRERNLSTDELAARLKLSPSQMDDLLEGRLPISLSLARDLSASLGGSAEFWVAREAQYLDDLARVNADRWAQGMPVRQMATFGWIKQPRTWLERIEACLGFFGVEDVDSWRNRYGRLVEASHFRRSPSYELEASATAAWFRACDKAADLIDGLRPFDHRSFERTLADVRPLTRTKEPEHFVPELTAKCASAGVSVVVVRAPKGCPASGATRLYRGRPLIQLSGRFLSDDHLWFTFFHEAAHVLLHDLETPFLDVLDDEEQDSLEEEANHLAHMWLMGRSEPGQGPLSQRNLVRIANANGVSPGIVVGQLQHSGRLRRNQFNALKRRYSWNGVTLGTAQRS